MTDTITRTAYVPFLLVALASVGLPGLNHFVVALVLQEALAA